MGPIAPGPAKVWLRIRTSLRPRKPELRHVKPQRPPRPGPGRGVGGGRGRGGADGAARQGRASIAGADRGRGGAADGLWGGGQYAAVGFRAAAWGLCDAVLSGGADP